jgi:hypothetical protein
LGYVYSGRFLQGVVTFFSGHPGFNESLAQLQAHRS